MATILVRNLFGGDPAAAGVYLQQNATTWTKGEYSLIADPGWEWEIDGPSGTLENGTGTSEESPALVAWDKYEVTAISSPGKLPVGGGTGESVSSPGTLNPIAPGVPDKPENYVGTFEQELTELQQSRALLNLGIEAGGVSLESFGGDPDGVIDSSTALTAALATGETVLIGGVGNSFLISSSVTVPAGASIVGTGGTLKTTSNIPILIYSTGCTVQGVKFEGNSTGTLQRGIFIDGGAALNAVLQTRTTLCSFVNFGGAGYYVTRVVASHEGHHISNSLFTGCAIGIDADDRGEYTLLSGCNIDTCTTGIRIEGGNTLVTSCIISDCADGIILDPGTNDAHGSVSSCLINHCTRAVKSNGINVAEFNFTDCKFYFGGIQIYDSNRISFNECVKDATGQITFDNSIGTCFNNCHFVTVPTFNHNFNSSTTKTFFVNCKYPAGTYVQSGGKIIATVTGTDDALTSSATPQVITFDTAVASMPHQPSYTHDDLWDEIGFNVQNIRDVETPGSGISVDVSAGITIGVASGAVDYSLISVYIEDDITGNVLAILTPGPQIGTNPGLSRKLYSYSGKLPFADYKVMVANNSGAALVVHYEQGGNQRAFLQAEGF
jgi:hypothetical protein